MIKTFAKSITNKLVSKNILNIEEKEMYYYCFETLIVIVITIFVLLSMSLIFDELLYSLIFYFSFLLFRKVCGGYHTDNYIKCSIFSLLSYLFFIVMLKTSFLQIKMLFIIIFLALVIIFMLSPIENDNKPFTQKQYVCFKVISKTLSISIIATLLIVILTGKYVILNIKYYYCFAFGIGYEAIALILSILERRRKNEKNN